MRVAVLIDDISFPYRGLKHSYLKSEGRFPQAILYGLSEIPMIESLECKTATRAEYGEPGIQFVSSLSGHYDLVIDSCWNNHDKLGQVSANQRWCTFNQGFPAERVGKPCLYDVGLCMTDAVRRNFAHQGFSGKTAVIPPSCPSLPTRGRGRRIFFAPTSMIDQCNTMVVLKAFERIHREYRDSALFVCSHAFSELQGEYHKTCRWLASLLPVRGCSYLEYYDWLREMANSSIVIDLDLHNSWFASYSLAQGAITVVREDHSFEFVDPEDLVYLPPNKHKHAVMDPNQKGEELAGIIRRVWSTPQRGLHKFLKEKYSERYHPRNLAELLKGLIDDYYLHHTLHQERQG